MKRHFKNLVLIGVGDSSSLGCTKAYKRHFQNIMCVLEFSVDTLVEFKEIEAIRNIQKTS